MSQLIRVPTATADNHSGVVYLTWRNFNNDGNVRELFATVKIIYVDASEWLSSRTSITRLIQGQVEAPERLTAECKANRFSRNMSYTFLGNNVVGSDTSYVVCNLQ